jgi:hypothetical protein
MQTLTQTRRRYKFSHMHEYIHLHAVRQSYGTTDVKLICAQTSTLHKQACLSHVKQINQYPTQIEEALDAGSHVRGSHSTSKKSQGNY